MPFLCKNSQFWVSSHSYNIDITYEEMCYFELKYVIMYVLKW